MTPLEELAERIHANAVAKGFHDPVRRLPEMLMLAASELGESFDAWRDDPDRPVVLDMDGKPEGWAVEVIDCIIVGLDIIKSYAPRVDIDELMLRKMEYNEQRPPRHGRGI